jgi:hypothetical protein
VIKMLNIQPLNYYYKALNVKDGKPHDIVAIHKHSF